MHLNIHLESIVSVAAVVCCLTSNSVAQTTKLDLTKNNVAKIEFTQGPLAQKAFRKYPIVAPTTGVTNIRWIPKNANIKTAKVNFLQKPAFLKCAKKDKRYDNEIEITKKIFDLSSTNKQCNLPYWSLDLFSRVEKTFDTTDGFNCAVYLRKESAISLRQFINQNPTDYRYKLAYMITRQLLVANAYLHCNNIVHRDIQPNNIIIDVNETGLASLQLINFYTSTKEKASMMGTLRCETYSYCSPETFMHDGYRSSFPKSESWSIGVVLYELLMGKLPYNNYFGLHAKKIQKKYKSDVIKAFQANEIKHELITIDPEFKILLIDMMLLQLSYGSHFYWHQGLLIDSLLTRW
ncbi:kinase-like domain-containing protein [Syncephalis fuscata]|nr:kinase-like domain-containing protein [Syncephalis fuscata]